MAHQRVPAGLRQGDGQQLAVARTDFQNKLAVNFAIRLGETFIGEAVLYRFDYKGGAELGCRILPEFAGNGFRASSRQRRL